MKIIAEAGISHCGDMDCAKKLILSAKDCGADMIKFQSYIPHKLFFGKDIIKREKLMLNRDQYQELYEWSKDIDIAFGVSIFDIDVMDYEFDFIKIASRSIYLSEAIIQNLYKDIPVYISCGYAMPKKITGTMNKKDITFMACDSSYPSDYFPCDDILRLIKDFGQAGYSSHFIGWDDCLMAKDAGVGVIEKHFCLSRDDIEIDRDWSLEPTEFKKMVRRIK